MANLPSIDLSWLGGGVGGLLRGGRSENAGGSIYGGQRTVGKDMLEGVGVATDEKFANDSAKAQSLRKLFSLYGADLGMPEAKDRAQTMSLRDLEGSLRAYVIKQDQAERQQQAEARNVAMQAQHLQMQATAQNLQQQQRAAQDEQAGQSALGRYFQAYGNQPPESLQAPGYDPQTRALAMAGPDLARGRIGASLMPYLLPKPESAVDQRRLAIQERGLDLEQGRLDAEMDRLNRGGTSGAATPAPPTVTVTETAANGNRITRKLTEDQYAARVANNPARASEMARLEAELAMHEKQIADKDDRYGLANVLSRHNRVAAIKGRLAALRAETQGATPSASEPSAPAVRFKLVNGELVPVP
jgi:hypothetical protein